MLLNNLIGHILLMLIMLITRGQFLWIVCVWKTAFAYLLYLFFVKTFNWPHVNNKLSKTCFITFQQSIVTVFQLFVLHRFSGLFTNTSEQIHFYFVVFFCLHFLVFGSAA